MNKIGTLLICLVLVLMSSFTAPAFASPGSDHKVTLCHATNSDTNPYVEITVDDASVFKQGHDGHNGPVWNPTLKPNHTTWGDIIPAFDYKDKKGTTLHYAGKNQSAEGQAILANGCVVPTSTPSPTPSVTPSESVSPTPSDSPTPSNSPTTSHSPKPSDSPKPTHTNSPKTHVIPPVHVTKPPKHGPSTLPFTGAAVAWLSVIGGGLLLAGASLMYFVRTPKYLAKHAKV